MLLAIGREGFVESDLAPRNVPIKGQSEKDIRRHAFEYKSRLVLESELPVVVWMTNETASATT
jgi:hypothetical protein